MPDRSDPSLFERAVLPHLDAGYNVARWILRNEADARDAVQESSMRAWRFFDSMRGHDALPWFLQIVRNTAYSLLERRRGAAHLSLADDAPLVDESAPDPAQQFATRIETEGLRQAVEDLPEPFREAIVLRELEGLSYKEIAAVTGVSMGTVMSRLARARQRLSAALAPDTPKELDHGM